MRSPDPNGKGVKETHSQQAASAGPSLRLHFEQTKLNIAIIALLGVLTLYPLRVPNGTQCHNFVNI